MTYVCKNFVKVGYKGSIKTAVPNAVYAIRLTKNKFVVEYWANLLKQEALLVLKNSILVKVVAGLSS